MAYSPRETSSTCSQYGSSRFSRPRSGPSRGMYQGEDLDAFLFSAIDVKTAQMIGDRNVVCDTEAAHKANKLNRSEQCKLEHYKERVRKQENMHYRQNRQMEKVMRAKRAKLRARIDEIEEGYETGSSSGKWRPMSLQPRVQSKMLIKRPRSQPVRSRKGALESMGGQNCSLCSQIQKIVQLYEKETRSTYTEQNPLEHSTCLFSDMQMKTFLQLLEEKHFQEVPNLATELRETTFRADRASKLSRYATDVSFEKKNVDKRIKAFLTDVDKFNKKHKSIPETVKSSLEKARYDNATLIKPSPFKSFSLRQEAEHILSIKTI